MSACLSALAFLWTSPLVAELPPEASDRMLQQLKHLASDDLEGRGVGTRGLDLAADAVRDAFADTGLDVTSVDGGAFQEFEVIAGTELLSPNELVLVKPDGERLTLTYDTDVRTGSFGAAGEFSAPPVFCGYGIVHTESEEVEGKTVEKVIYDDFSDVDVRGKIAVILRRTPQQADENGLFGGPHSGTSRHAALNTKLKNAIDRGAVAVLFVNDGYSGRAELTKLKERQTAAEQRVIDAAIALVAGEESDPHGAPHAHGHPPHAAPSSEPHDNDTAIAEAQESGASSAPPAAEGPETAPSATDNSPVDAHVAASPHHPPVHGAVHGSSHGHGDVAPGESLTAAVTHLQEVRKLIENYNPDPMMAFGYNGDRRGDSIPVMQITRAALDPVIKAGLGKSLDELEADIDAAGKPLSADLSGWTAAGQTSLHLNRVKVKNVIGVIPGEGPLAKETIVIGAHYDHLGRGGEGSMLPGSVEIHNGADDNASGTVALMELARRLAEREVPLPRRVVFIAFTGEEKGLLGSAHYVKEPIFPIESTVAMFNMDMVGRLTDDKLTVFGSGTATRWDDLLGAGSEKYAFDLSKKPEGFGPSDHSSFYAKEIPVLHFFTGTHNDYHRPTDDWDKLNIEGMGRIVDLIEDLVVATAHTEERPEYVAVKGRADMQSRTGSRPYFGSIPDFGGEENGYALQGVSPGSPADKGGLKGGDVIIKLGKHAVTGLDDFDLALREFSAGEEVIVTVRRNGEEHELRVTLATPR
ncbi:MAG: M20/M25/M40 family metallo-hydrolase [Planctomycetaceae bacterium]|nr:M20/M25/M40 family metallo-hydrolase [Planctomycetaceae bacterium]